MKDLVVVNQSISRKEWSLNEKKKNIDAITNLFTGAKLEFEPDYQANKVRVSYETGLPKKPVMFLGLIVDLDDGMVYFSRLLNAEAVKLGNVNGLMSYVMGRGVSRDVALMAIEKFKLTGSIKKTLDLNDEFLDGSIISQNVNQLTSDSESVKRIRFLSIMQIVDNAFESFRSLIGMMVNWADDDQKGEMKRNFTASTSYTRQLPSEGKGEEYDAHIASCATFWTGYEVSSVGSKQVVLASNAVELCDAMDGAEDFVFSTDLKKRVRELGFDKILTNREISSVVSNPKYVDAVKDQISNDADINKIRWSTTSETRYAYQNGTSKNSVIIRNTIKMLSKLYDKIRSIRG